eukprot:403347078
MEQFQGRNLWLVNNLDTIFEILMQIIYDCQIQALIYDLTMFLTLKKLTFQDIIQNLEAKLFKITLMFGQYSNRANEVAAHYQLLGSLDGSLLRYLINFDTKIFTTNYKITLN